MSPPTSPATSSLPSSPPTPPTPPIAPISISVPVREESLFKCRLYGKLFIFSSSNCTSSRNLYV
jgi:hypothetical protein